MQQLQSAKETLHFPPAALDEARITAQYPKGTRLITMTGILPVEALVPGQVIMGADGAQRKVLSVRAGVPQNTAIMSRTRVGEVRRTRFPAQHDRMEHALDALYEVQLDVVAAVPCARLKRVNPAPHSMDTSDDIQNIFAA